MNTIFSNITTAIFSLIESLGYLGIALLLFVENIFPPIPSELILPLTGFLVSKGEYSFTGVLLASSLGTVGGALLLYYLGRKFGEKRIENFSSSYGSYIGIKKKEIQKSRSWFETHGGKIVFFGRLIPTIRSLISLPAGLTKMPLGKFLLYTSLGSIFWNTLLITLGWYLGEQWQKVQEYTRFFKYGILLFFIGGIGLYIWKKKK